MLPKLAQSPVVHEDGRFTILTNILLWLAHGLVKPLSSLAERSDTANRQALRTTYGLSVPTPERCWILLLLQPGPTGLSRALRDKFSSDRCNHTMNSSSCQQIGHHHMPSSRTTSSQLSMPLDQEVTTSQSRACSYCSHSVQHLQLPHHEQYHP